MFFAHNLLSADRNSFSSHMSKAVAEEDAHHETKRIESTKSYMEVTENLV
jgi:hypothetical protein